MLRSVLIVHDTQIGIMLHTNCRAKEISVKFGHVVLANKNISIPNTLTH